jgi:hypothetical protein
VDEGADDAGGAGEGAAGWEQGIEGNLAMMALSGIAHELKLERFALISQAEDASLEHLYQLAERQLRPMAHRAQALVELQQRIDRADARQTRGEP